jgi:copper(I)-binding protein
VIVHRFALAVLLVLAAGCIHYPTVQEAGSPRIRPENGRVVRQTDDGLAFYVDLHSTGKFGDVIVGAQTTMARDARLVDGAGSTVQRVEIPGLSVFPLREGATHVRLGGLSRSLQRGEVIIVTLVLEKTGKLGVVTVVE